LEIRPTLRRHFVNDQEARLAIEALGKLGPAAKSALPHVVDAYYTSDVRLWRAAEAALRSVDPDTAEKLGIR
jgi:hypothetical protein